MRLRLLISISLFALALQKICAQSADDFFHGGAQAYLTNNTTLAKEQVDKGLKLYPDDIKLKKLDELLKQQQQQQQQQQQNQQQKQDQKNQSQSKQDQQQKSDEQKQKEKQKQQEQQKPQQQKRDQDKQGEKPKEQPAQSGQMTPEEAKQLLDAQKGDEMLLPANNKDKHNRDHPLKDW